LVTATLDKSIRIEGKSRLVVEAIFDYAEPFDREFDVYDKSGGKLTFVEKSEELFGNILFECNLI